MQTLKNGGQLRNLSVQRQKGKLFCVCTFRKFELNFGYLHVDNGAVYPKRKFGSIIDYRNLEIGDVITYNYVFTRKKQQKNFMPAQANGFPKKMRWPKMR